MAKTHRTAPLGVCEIMIEVRQLTKAYPDTGDGAFTALDAVSLQAGRGTIYGLLGPNGAGKTTLLRMLCTVLKPTSGTALIHGFDITDQPEQVRFQLGFVSHNTAIYDRMTAREMVLYFGRLYGIPDETLRERMHHIFADLQLLEYQDRLGSKLSTGMKQKVSIARALVHDPPVLIFDEATVGLDVLAARSLLDVVAKLRDRGKCILFSTHILREAEQLCDHLGILHRGRLLAEGTLPDLLCDHQERDLDGLFFGLMDRHEPTFRREFAEWSSK